MFQEYNQMAMQGGMFREYNQMAMEPIQNQEKKEIEVRKDEMEKKVDEQDTVSIYQLGDEQVKQQDLAQRVEDKEKGDNGLTEHEEDCSQELVEDDLEQLVMEGVMSQEYKHMTMEPTQNKEKKGLQVGGNMEEQIDEQDNASTYQLEDEQVKDLPVCQMV
eukprot:GFUD01074793.1.p1 GENE.GFUD01074793.1~~GFUD01074793.1.p1  ORF type:complete len:161 (+),score=69.17 GFUD01074793.1:2-484(+)